KLKEYNKQRKKQAERRRKTRDFKIEVKIEKEDEMQVLGKDSEFNKDEDEDEMQVSGEDSEFDREEKDNKETDYKDKRICDSYLP
ncbi:12948_t:CDS:1, partial [Racocetra fulgida]